MTLNQKKIEPHRLLGIKVEGIDLVETAYYESFEFLSHDKFFIISPELRQIPSLPLIQTIQFNLKFYLAREPLLEVIRHCLIESLNKHGILKYFDTSIKEWIIVISKPELMKEVFHRTDAFQKLGKNEQKMEKAEFEFIGHDNLLYEIKEAHLRHRRISNPAFSHSWPPELFGNLAIELFEVMDKVSEKSPTLEIHHFTKKFSLDVIGLAAFGCNFGGIKGILTTRSKLEKAYDTAIDGMSDMKYVIFPILEKIPGFRRPELFNQIDYLNGVMLDIIKERKKILKFKKVNNDSDNNYDDDYDGPRDLLYYMLKAEEAQDDLKSHLTTEELLNNMKLFLTTGHETLSIALAAAIYFLGMNQECQEKAREEAIRIIGDEKKNIIPNSEQIKELKYINMVIKETLRIHPSAPITTVRRTQKDTRLGEYAIKEGAILIPEIYASHHFEESWEESHKFKPERFVDEKDTANKYFPFGSGSRICIGMNFSLAEQRVFLAMLVRKYSWKVTEPNIHKDKLQVKPALYGFAAPKNLEIDFERRY
ncbi:hypothetical protein Glove_180g114 [Diversispora epigaea]|uniref:Cytochrome P450 n=1 Tax=Diversispora epigaea TaxID=1348612 RepID=A0A397ISY1_9GLOM|nr:hypothetical protein Glove_180g114 [Diversispora epigaea]